MLGRSISVISDLRREAPSKYAAKVRYRGYGPHGAHQCSVLTSFWHMHAHASIAGTHSMVHSLKHTSCNMHYIQQGVKKDTFGQMEMNVYTYMGDTQWPTDKAQRNITERQTL